VLIELPRHSLKADVGEDVIEAESLGIEPCNLRDTQGKRQNEA
jgi:hypothetical protein